MKVRTFTVSRHTPLKDKSLFDANYQRISIVCPVITTLVSLHHLLVLRLGVKFFIDCIWF